MNTKPILEKIEVSMQFANEWQHSLHAETIKIMLNTYKSHMESANKKNQCTISFTLMQ